MAAWGCADGVAPPAAPAPTVAVPTRAAGSASGSGAPDLVEVHLSVDNPLTGASGSVLMAEYPEGPTPTLVEVTRSGVIGATWTYDGLPAVSYGPTGSPDANGACHGAIVAGGGYDIVGISTNDCGGPATQVIAVAGRVYAARHQGVLFNDPPPRADSSYVCGRYQWGACAIYEGSGTVTMRRLTGTLKLTASPTSLAAPGIVRISFVTEPAGLPLHIQDLYGVRPDGTRLPGYVGCYNSNWTRDRYCDAAVYETATYHGKGMVNGDNAEATVDVYVGPPKLTLTASASEVEAGDSVTFTGVVTPTDASYQVVGWSWQPDSTQPDSLPPVLTSRGAVSQPSLSRSPSAAPRLDMSASDSAGGLVDPPTTAPCTHSNLVCAVQVNSSGTMILTADVNGVRLTARTHVAAVSVCPQLKAGTLIVQWPRGEARGGANAPDGTLSQWTVQLEDLTFIDYEYVGRKTSTAWYALVRPIFSDDLRWMSGGPVLMECVNGVSHKSNGRTEWLGSFNIRHIRTSSIFDAGTR